MAQLLGVAREWLSKIENGKTPVSADVFLKFESVKREFEHTSQRAVQPTLPVAGQREPFVAIDAVVTPGPVETLRGEVRKIFEDTLAAAGSDTGRIGYLREQLLQHFAVPDHWRARRPASGAPVPVSLPSQTTLLSTHTGKPIEGLSVSRPARTG